MSRGKVWLYAVATVLLLVLMPRAASSHSLISNPSPMISDPAEFSLPDPPYRLLGETAVAGYRALTSSDLAIVAGTTTRVSVSSAGVQGNKSSTYGSLSADGRYVVFDSYADNLVENDTNSLTDIFVHDRQTGQTTRVSVASDGTQANEGAYDPCLSADGRYVVYSSSADNLVESDTNGRTDIFMYDRETGETTRVSLASDGTQANGSSIHSSVSSDGRYVAFSSQASNLVEGDTNLDIDVFVRDRQSGLTTRVSVASDGTQANNHAMFLDMSADGRHVAFASFATNLVGGDTNGNTDIFVHDLDTGETSRVSVSSGGTQGNGESSFAPAISWDGRYVAFRSSATNLVPGDTNNVCDVFVHDRITGETSRVSVASDGTQSNGESEVSCLSADGRYVAFASDADNVVEGDTNEMRDAFVHDRQTGQTIRVSVSSDGVQGNGYSVPNSLSHDGSFIAFGSWSDNLVLGDSNGMSDIFVYARLGTDPSAALTYIGPQYLPAESVMNESGENELITVGDHVHLRLPFWNLSSIPLSHTLELTGTSHSPSSPGVLIYDGVGWEEQTSIQLTSHSGDAVFDVGEAGYADFWIYTTSPDPTQVTSTWHQAQLQMRLGSRTWELPISIMPFMSQIWGHEELLAGSCLHNPSELAIRSYAQYAVSAREPITPTDVFDADTPEQAVTNMVAYMREDFATSATTAPRQPDIELLPVTLPSSPVPIGVCRHFSDLTVGLLRSMGFASRFTDAAFLFPDGRTEWHAWVEVYWGQDDQGGDVWRHVDSTWKKAFNEHYYASEKGIVVYDAYADLYPLSSAQWRAVPEMQCTECCYQWPISCPLCLLMGQYSYSPSSIELDCVERVDSRYNPDSQGVSRLSTDGELLIGIEAPVLVTRTIPFTIGVSTVNSTTLSLTPLTVTVAANNDYSVTLPIYGVANPFRVYSEVGPGETVTASWVITPLVTGSGIPLSVAATDGEFFGSAGVPLVVKEPGAPPPLTLGGVCGLGSVGPGQAISLTAYVLDEYLQPLTDTSTAVTASIHTVPTSWYSASVPLEVVEDDELFQALLVLPEGAPLGRYEVDVVATRPGYGAADEWMVFFVTPPLTMTLTVTPTAVMQRNTLTITAQVSDRGTLVTDASVWSRISTPSGPVIVPLVYGSGVFSATLRPLDLGPNLGGSVIGGQWQIQAQADYMGGAAETTAVVTVFRKVYLPIVLRDL